MTEAVGQYQRMHDPDVKKFYPCVIYHARHDGRTRGDHAQFDGMIFDKDDPWLLTHTPPWEFNCRCWLENAERPDDPGKVRPFGRPTVDSKSGFVFRPDLAFEADDLAEHRRGDAAAFGLLLRKRWSSVSSGDCEGSKYQGRSPFRFAEKRMPGGFCPLPSGFRKV